MGSPLTQTLALGPDPATPSSPVSCPLHVVSNLEESSVYGLTSLSHLCHDLSNPLKWCRSLAESPPCRGTMPVVVVYKGALYKECPVLFRGATRPRVSLHQIWQKTLLLGHGSPCHKSSAPLLSLLCKVAKSFRLNVFQEIVVSCSNNIEVLSLSISQDPCALNTEQKLFLYPGTLNSEISLIRPCQPLIESIFNQS